MKGVVDPRMPEPLFQLPYGVPVHVPVTFQDVETLKVLTARFGYGLDVLQLDQGISLEGSFQVTVINGLVFFRITTNASLLWTGNRLADYTPFAIEPLGARGQQVHGQELPSPAVLCGFYQRLSDTYFTSAAGGETLIALVPTAEISSRLELAGLSDRLEEMDRSNMWLLTDVDLKLFSNCIDRRAQAPKLDLDGSRTEVFYTALIQAIGNAQGSERYVHNDDREVMQMLLGWARENLSGTPVGMKEVLAALPVGKTKLSAATKKAIGMAPMNVMKALRLQQVRTAILDPARQQELGTGSNVLKIAAHYGFTTRQHFARDYQKQFGEKPSETAGQLRLAA